MRYLKQIRLGVFLPCLAVLASAAIAAPPRLPAEPAKIDIQVAPDPVAPGSETRITLRLSPMEGVKVNRYPQIKLEVPARDGLHPETRVSVGNDSPPPPDDMDSNYFKTVDPIELMLTLDDAAPSGSHEIEGKLTYFYCVTKSGFCAPKRVAVKIPVRVE